MMFKAYKTKCNKQKAKQAKLELSLMLFNVYEKIEHKPKNKTNKLKVQNKNLLYYGAYNMTKLFEFELCKFELLTSVI